MRKMNSIVFGVVLQSAAVIASAQALDVNIMDDLTPEQQQQVRNGFQVTITNPISPTPNVWMVSY